MQQPVCHLSPPVSISGHDDARYGKQLYHHSANCLAHAGMQPHASLPENFHLTVFMTSQPGDPRPDPFTPGGGIDVTHPPIPIPAPTASTMQKEVDVCRQIALTGAPAFEVQG